MSLVGLSESALTTPRSGIRDVFDAAGRLPDVISFAVGEPSESVPASAARAAVAAIDRGDTHYTDVLGVEVFRQAVADYTQRVKHLTYDPQTEIQAVPGATLGLYLALRVLLNPGDEVVIPSPHFTSYDAQVHLCGALPVYAPLRPEDGMRITAEIVEQAISERTKVLLVNSPSNPTGAVTDARELERIAEVCRRHGIWVISDEVYHAFVYHDDIHDEAAAPTIAAVPGMQDRTIIVDSLSKTYAMTGWRIGYLLAPASIVEETAKIAELIHSSINSPAQFAGAAALRELDADVRRMRADYRHKRQIVLDALAGSRSLRTITPAGAFYAFVDVHGTGLSSAAFSDRLLRTHHVAVVPGETFGAAGDGFVRLSYAGDAAEIAEGMRRMVEFADDLA